MPRPRDFFCRIATEYLRWRKPRRPHRSKSHVHESTRELAAPAELRERDRRAEIAQNYKTALEWQRSISQSQLQSTRMHLRLACATVYRHSPPAREPRR